MASSTARQGRTPPSRRLALSPAAGAIALASIGLVAGLIVARDLVLSVGGFSVIFLPALAVAWSMRRAETAPWVDLVPAAALALGIVALSGLVLNLLPYGLNLGSWVAVGGTLLVIAWALGRGRRVTVLVLAMPGSVPRRQWLLLVAAGMLTLSALAVARLAVTGPAEAFSQLWITPGSAPGTMQVGIQNDEGASTEYRLELDLDGATIGTWPSIHVGHDERWTTDVQVAVPSGSVLEARLFRQSDPGTVYRRVTMGAEPGSASSGTGDPGGAG